MKTLADFKRALELGSVWMRKHVNEDKWVERKVIKTGSTFVCFAGEDTKHAENGVTFTFPKASEFEINEKGEAEIYYAASEIYNLPRRLILTYRMV